MIFFLRLIKRPASKTFANDIDEKLAKIQELKGKVDKEPEVKDNDAETFLVLQKINQKADELRLLLSLKDEIRTSEGLSNSLEIIINDVGEVIDRKSVVKGKSVDLGLEFRRVLFRSKG